MKSPLFVAILIVFVLTQCALFNADAVSCKCPKMLRPSCGADGKDYNHPCLAECAGTVS